MKGADAGTRVGERRLCWRWVAEGGLGGDIGRRRGARGLAAQRVAGQGGR